MGEIININVPEWERQVTAECMKFIEAVRRNFNYGLNTSLKYLPDQNNHQQRAIQLQYFIDSMIGVCVQEITEYHSRDEKFEELVLESVKNKFKYIRERYAEIEAEKAKNPEPAKSNLILAPESRV